MEILRNNKNKHLEQHLPNTSFSSQNTFKVEDFKGRITLKRSKCKKLKHFQYVYTAKFITLLNVLHY